VDRAILSKFGFEKDFNIAKRVLLLNPTMGVDFQLHMDEIF